MSSKPPDCCRAAEEAVPVYSTAMEDLAEALRAARAAGGPKPPRRGLAPEPPTVYRVLRTGGTGYETRLDGAPGSTPWEP